MAISRDSRMDRRRRVLRDSSQSASAAQSTGGSRSAADAAADAAGGKRPVSYSQDVRQACSLRLMQLIPVRRRSFLAVLALSLSVVGALLAAHYLIYVSGHLPWYGHPLAVALEATHPQSIAAWLGSHLWLLCLGATILAFQVRRHRLDDYNGEYRLWFWLVLTCLLASLDSTTHLTELFGYALDRWSQLNLGWSGRAVVQSTLAALIAVLGLKLISELKSVPFSLICWLGGLLAWAGSAALAQEMLRIDISLQMRFWLRATLWLGGLTLIWMAALSYLRRVFMEAQQRFPLSRRLTRGKSAPPLGQRLRQALSLIGRSSRGRSRSKRRRGRTVPWRQGCAPLSQVVRRPAVDAPTATGSMHSSGTVRSSPHPSVDQPTKGRRFRLWPGSPPPAEELDEYRKVRAAASQDVRDSEARTRVPIRPASNKVASGDRSQAEGASAHGCEAPFLASDACWYCPSATCGTGQEGPPALLGRIETLPAGSQRSPTASNPSDRPRLGCDLSIPLRTTGTPWPGTNDADDEADRHLSKAERKRLRRHGRAA